MDWKALVDIGMGAAALLMAKKLQVAVGLLTDLVKGHEAILQAHDKRITRVEIKPNGLIIAADGR